MSNPFIAAVRSVVQALASLVVVAVANYVLVELGVTLDAVALTEALSLVAFGGLVYGLNALGQAVPFVNTVLSLGFSAAGASYEA